MPLENSRGFILGSKILNDQDKIVSVLTEDRGIIKAVAPGALKNSNRFGSMLELFTEVDFFYYSKEGKELVTFSKGDIVKSYFDTVSHPAGVFYYFFIAEVVERFIPSEFKAKRLYRLISSILKSGNIGVSPEKLLLYFMIWFLKIEGLMFNPRQCYSCQRKGLSESWVKIDYSGTVCSSCRSVERIALKGLDVNFIEWVMKNPPHRLEEQANFRGFLKLLRVFKKKIEFHGEMKLNSARYLKEFN